jgi:two-component system, OmpR family, sensor kinase
MNGYDAVVARLRPEGRSRANRGALATPLTSLRGKLAATATAGFVLTGLMTVLVLQTTREAHQVVEQAQASHDRMRVFARLQSTASRLQRLTYQNARTENVQSAGEVRAARADFVAALAALHTIPDPSVHERVLVETVERRGQAVLALFSHGGEDIVKAVNEAWRTAGSRAALQEVQLRSEPYRIFADTVTREVERGDQQLTNATSRALAQQRSVQEAALVGLALALGLSVAVFALLLTRLGPGLKRLEQAARAFGSGELAHRIRLTGRDELAQLAAVFNLMAQEISEKQLALEESRAGLERAVAARTAELERANSALSAEDERRRTFLADASHELRMPLTIIRGETQVALRAGLQGSQDVTEVFERILEQTRVLTRLFDDLFLIARAEAGGLRLNLCTLDLGELVRRVAHDFSTIACESGATVQVEASSGLAARVDPDRVRQALAALIDNALRHTGAGVYVRVEARATGDWITITVTDDGPGIDSGMAAELFGRFRRGRTRGDGSGLGLTVVRALAEAHGGTASLGNAEHGGAQATLRLPQNTQSSIEPAEPVPVQLMARSFQPGSAAASTPVEEWSDVVAAGGG